MEIKILNNPLSLGLAATDTEEEFKTHFSYLVLLTEITFLLKGEVIFSLYSLHSS